MTQNLLSSKVQRQQVVDLLAEDQRRKKELLKVYRPLTETHQQAHLCDLMEILFRGGNRAGKSIWAAAEFASAALGIPIIGMDGNPLPLKYSKPPLTMWVIGFDLKHIGQTIYRLLFMPGCGGDLKVLPDGKGGYRLFNPADPADAKRADEAELTEPFIPARFVDQDSWDWDKKAGHLFHSVRLKNGTSIFAFASTGNIKQGDAVDVVWIDEDIEYPEYVYDWRMRIASRQGRIFWSAFPWNRNDALRDMSERAEKQASTDNPVVAEFRASFSGNKFIDAQTKEQMFRDLPEEVRLARDEGDWCDESVLMYPEFSVGTHGLPRKDAVDDKLAAIWEAQKEFPRNWARFLACDPGHATNAFLSLVIPPPDDYGEVVIVEWEIYLRNATKQKVAAACKHLMKGRTYHAFLMDPHAGAQTTMGHHQKIKDQYAEAFHEVGLQSQLTGHGFKLAEGMPQNRWPIVREAMAVRADGTTRLRIVQDQCPKLVWEFGRYKRRVAQGGKREDIPVDKDNHAIHALEYGLCNNLLRYYDPPTTSTQEPVSKFDKLFVEPTRNSGSIHLGAGSLSRAG